MADACVVIPVFEHGSTIGRVVASARRCGLVVVLVDDGSRPGCAQVLDGIAQSGGGIYLLRHPANRGKGAAVQTGLRYAAALGYTHALQIDADAQHDLNDIPRFIEAARAHPDALICGRPIFGADAPRSRLHGRRLTNFWVSVNTWSADLPDAMCGFRVYPLATTMPLLAGEGVGSRMDFDIEILVRLHWLGVPMFWLPTAVTYPQGGTSQFRMTLDNARITRIHTALFFGMLARTPMLLARKFAQARHRQAAK